MCNFYVITRVISATHLSGEAAGHFKRGHPYVFPFDIWFLYYLSCCRSFTGVKLKHSLYNSTRISI